jgi:hypothetical protein
MFSPSRFQIGVCLASVMVLSSVADAATKNLSNRVAQMTPDVCWESCSGMCDKTYEKCVAKPAQDTQCRTARVNCHDQCSVQCGFKK